MKRTFLSKLLEWYHRRSSTPWASFETGGVDSEGRVAFTISWNDAFIEQLQKTGYMASSEEELVQMFFLATRMVPEDSLSIEDGMVNSEGHPNLSGESNILRR